MEPIQFDLEDKQGEMHSYEVYPHGAKAGSELIFQLAAMASEPLLEAVKYFVGQADSGTSVGDVEVGNLLDSLDLSKIGGSLKDSLRRLDGDTVHRFFQHTTRDGKRLRVESEYDQAYAANWGEWQRALRKIVEVNGFVDFLPTSSGS